MERADATGAQAAADGKLQVEDAGAEVVAAIRARAGELESAWADSLDAGYDGRAALAEFRKMTSMAQCSCGRGWRLKSSLRFR